jgi:hypothetical protein
MFCTFLKLPSVWNNPAVDQNNPFICAAQLTVNILFCTAQKSTLPNFAQNKHGITEWAIKSERKQDHNAEIIHDLRRFNRRVTPISYHLLMLRSGHCYS